MAQSIAGTELAARWADISSRPAYKVEVDWNRDGTFEDETDLVLDIRIEHSVYDSTLGLPALGEAPPESATVIMDNSSRRYSANNPGGIAGTYTFLSNGIYRIPIRISMGYYNSAGVSEMTRQFTGEIETTLERESASRVTCSFDCVGRGVELLQHKISTLLYHDVRTDAFVDALLEEAGFVVTNCDLGSSHIPYVWTDDENIWSEIHDLAASEGALFYFSKEGVPFFKRLTTFLERPDSVSPVLELNEGNAVSYSDSIAWRDCYTDVIVEWATRYQGLQAEVYKSPSPLVIPPRTTYSEDIKYRWPVTHAVSPVYQEDYVSLTSGARPLSPSSGAMEVFLESGGQGGTLTIINHMDRHTLYVLDLVVRGFPLIGDEAYQERFTSHTGLIPGEKIYEIRGNPYIQTPEQAWRLGGYLKDWLSRPRRIYTWKGPAIPWIEPLDRVTLKHNVMTPNPGTNVDCYVLSIKQDWRKNSLYEQELLLLACEHLFEHEDYFIIGASSYLDIDSDKVGY